MRHVVLLLAFVVLLRLPFLDLPFQGDAAAYYLPIAMHAQVDPAHPLNFKLTTGGAEIDMRGYPHPPLNAWFLAALLALFGDTREVPFHAAYIVFSLIAVLAMYSLARRFTHRPVLATLLLIAVPAFIVNGTSLEADVPHLAFWLAAIALWIKAVDRASARLAIASALAASLAALTAYQAVLLIPILGAYLWLHRRTWRTAWILLLSPIAVLGGWLAWERIATGGVPTAIALGYFREYALQTIGNKIRSGTALTAHMAWIVCPLLIGIFRGRRFLIVAAIVGIAALAATHDAHPLFWASFGAGAALAAATVKQAWRSDNDTRFLAAWFILFYLGALAIFFAGSARYLLPLSPALILLTTRRLESHPRLLAAGFAISFTLGFSFAFANGTHWKGYRDFISSLASEFRDHRVWINGEWNLPFYGVAQGGLPIVRGQAVRPGDVVISSELGYPIDFTTGGGVLTTMAEREISSRIPFRLIGLGSRSAYSTAGAGFRPFDISTAPIDVIRAQIVIERKPELSFLPMGSPAADSQIVSGAYELESGNQWRWIGQRLVALLKVPDHPMPIEATFRLIDNQSDREMTLAADGRTLATQQYTKPDLYTIRSSGPVAAQGGTATITLSTDRTFRAPGDQRDLGFILVDIGFKE